MTTCALAVQHVAAPEHNEVVGLLQRLSAVGDWERYPQVLSGGAARNYL